MTIEALIIAAIENGPRFVGGLPNIDRRVAEVADRAGRNIGTFLADMEELFPAEVEAVLGDAA